MAGVPWTEEEESILRKLADAGFWVKEMQLALKIRTRISIKNHLSDLGIYKRYPTDRINADILAVLDV